MILGRIVEKKSNYLEFRDLDLYNWDYLQQSYTVFLFFFFFSKYGLSYTLDLEW